MEAVVASASLIGIMAMPSPSQPVKLKRIQTSTLFAQVDSAPPIGGLVLDSPHSKFLLTPEVVLMEPSEFEIHRGGAPATPGKPGTRLIFLNTSLTADEQTALVELHQALEAEGEVHEDSEGEIPAFVRLHALRILQQAKGNVKKALLSMLTHLEMRVRMMPVSESAVIEDLRKGMMYWHGRDRKCRPNLVWRVSKIDQFDVERATRVILFIMEYGVRFCLVPGRVENWNLIIDLSGCGMSQATSNSRAIAKNVTRLLEEVYCGRNFSTKIFHLAWVIRAIVNTLIPEDKKSKVEFVSDKDIPSVMQGLCEPHQLEQQYGGSAPDVAAADVYPFRFFPNSTGLTGKDPAKQESLVEMADHAFHEGNLWDTYPRSKEKWEKAAKLQSLTPTAAKALEAMHPGKAVKPCQDMTSWLKIVSPDEAYSLDLVPIEENPDSPGGSPLQSNEHAAEINEAMKVADSAQMNESTFEPGGLSGVAIHRTFEPLLEGAGDNPIVSVVPSEGLSCNECSMWRC
ncbi:unnamed protein product [Polarella glacialis]|uniref:CRAL-TRIO domain-containing protein n=1 Tax=Polarella glacialis TaxID=89957 RepID=A0A813DXX1_POLGL|nr:unnamed protein product [Polarella glacialis]